MKYTLKHSNPNKSTFFLKHEHKKTKTYLNEVPQTSEVDRIDEGRENGN